MTDYSTRLLNDLRDLEAKIQTLSGPDLIAEAMKFSLSRQTDLARHSGLTPNTITALKQGKRPTAAQRAAIMWASVKLAGVLNTG
jgi:hypothetical protein